MATEPSPSKKDALAITPSVVINVSHDKADSAVTATKLDADAPPPGAEATEYIDASNLTRSQWMKLFTTSSVLKAWKKQEEGDRIHITRAPCAALALKGWESASHDIEFENLPDFEIADDTYIETRETKSALEREMTLKAFTESGIHAALGGGTPDISFGFGGQAQRQSEQEYSSTTTKSSTTVHGFYNFPRVIVHLQPDNLKLSRQCETFFRKHEQDCLDAKTLDGVLDSFQARFGTVLPTRVTLGGRLCTSEEVSAEDSEGIIKAKNSVRVELDATVKAAGFVRSGLGGRRQKDRESHLREHTQHESTRATTETQGGNGLLSSNVADWIQSVSSHRYWRTIQQDGACDVLTFASEVASDDPLAIGIRALSDHAHERRQRDLTFLEIEAQATVDADAEGDRLLNWTLTFSEPSLVNHFTIRKFHEGGDVGTVDYKNWEVQKINQGRETLSSRLPFPPPVNRRDPTAPRRSRHYTDRVITIQLEDSFTWTEQGMDASLLAGVRKLELEWNGIDLNRTVKWRKPFRRLGPVARYPEYDQHVRAQAMQARGKDISREDQLSLAQLSQQSQDEQSDLIRKSKDKLFKKKL